MRSVTFIQDIAITHCFSALARVSGQPILARWSLSGRKQDIHSPVFSFKVFFLSNKFYYYNFVQMVCGQCKHNIEKGKTLEYLEVVEWHENRLRARVFFVYFCVK